MHSQRRRSGPRDPLAGRCTEVRAVSELTSRTVTIAAAAFERPVNTVAWAPATFASPLAAPPSSCSRDALPRLPSPLSRALACPKLDPGSRCRRNRLSAGGDWIRTFSSARRWASVSGSPTPPVPRGRGGESRGGTLDHWRGTAARRLVLAEAAYRSLETGARASQFQPEVHP